MTCFVGKSQSSQHKTASSFRQTALARPVLSENPRVLGTKQPAHSDKTLHRDLFCRKILEFPAQKRRLIPTNRPRATCFVGKSQSSQRKTASSFRQNASSRPFLSEKHGVHSIKTPTHSDKTTPRELFCRKTSELSALTPAHFPPNHRVPPAVCRKIPISQKSPHIILL